MSRAYCVNLIINYYDSVINEVDIYTEKLLEWIDPNELASKRRIGRVGLNSSKDFLSGFEKYLTLVEPKFTPGVTKLVDYINSIRGEMIDQVNNRQRETLDFYYKNTKDFEIDPNQMNADRDDELKRRLFGKKFCFLFNTGRFYRFDINTRAFYDNENCLFTLYLVVFDHFVDQDSIRYVRYCFTSYPDENDCDRLEKIFTDWRILLLTPLVAYLSDCLIYSLGHQHLIDIRLNQLFYKKAVKIKLPSKYGSAISIQFIKVSPSPEFDFSHLTDLQIRLDHYAKPEYKLKSIGPFPNLTKLSFYAQYNKNILIENDTAFENLNNVTHLTLEYLVIKGREFDIHKEMPNLEDVRILNCEFREGAKLIGFDKLDKLEKFKYRHFNHPNQERRASNVSVSLDWFANSNVTHLEIGDYDHWNEFPRPFPNSLFPNLKNLSITNIYNTNDSTNTYYLEFECQSKLETFVFKRNRLFRLRSNLYLHKNLKCIEISSSNLLKIFPALFRGLKRLEELYLDGDVGFNQDESIRRVLKHLPNLKKLKFSMTCWDSCLYQLDPEWFMHSPKLIHLDLSNSRRLVLKKGDFQYLSNLKSLSLRDNWMKKLEDGVFLGLDNLEELDLVGNDLDEMSLHQLDGLKSLKRLNTEPKNKLDICLI